MKYGPISTGIRGGSETLGLNLITNAQFKQESKNHDHSHNQKIQVSYIAHLVNLFKDKILAIKENNKILLRKGREQLDSER